MAWRSVQDGMTDAQIEAMAARDVEMLGPLVAGLARDEPDDRAVMAEVQREVRSLLREVIAEKALRLPEAKIGLRRGENPTTASAKAARFLVRRDPELRERSDMLVSTARMILARCRDEGVGTVKR